MKRRILGADHLVLFSSFSVNTLTATVVTGAYKWLENNYKKTIDIELKRSARRVTK